MHNKWHSSNIYEANVSINVVFCEYGGRLLVRVLCHMLAITSYHLSFLMGHILEQLLWSCFMHKCLTDFHLEQF